MRSKINSVAADIRDIAKSAVSEISFEQLGGAVAGQATIGLKMLAKNKYGTVICSWSSPPYWPSTAHKHGLSLGSGIIKVDSMGITGGVSVAALYDELKSYIADDFAAKSHNHSGVYSATGHTHGMDHTHTISEGATRTGTSSRTKTEGS